MSEQTAINQLLPELADLPDILTLPEVGRILRISRTKAYTLASGGDLPALRVGGSVRVLKTSLENFITQNISSHEAD